MAEYDFKMLSDYDFELLIKDLLKAELGCPFESFKRGKDKGIDLRYSTNAQNKIIVQCKHYANSSFSDLKKSIKIEKMKVEKLLPERYIIASSYEFTVNQKDELFDILKPLCTSSCDILGKNDLNSLLRNYPEIEKGHYKLWLTSTAVLERIAHSDIYNRSTATLENILNRIKLYVECTSAYNLALDILNRTSCCIISGVPGIGKTTLAEILLIKYLDIGYEIVKVSQNISEAFEAFNDKNQIFYYDDFLGRTGLEIKIAKNEDSEIIDFINMVKKNKNSKLILTTREYILNIAKSQYENLSRFNFNINNCIIKLDDYTKYDKAKILYNHLYFYRLQNEYVNNLLNNDILKIVNHSNYSPRIVEIMTSLLLPPNAENFFSTFMSSLDNPQAVWAHAFNNISEHSRNMLLTMISLPDNVELKVAAKTYKEFNKMKSVEYNLPYREQDFENSLKELSRDFLAIDLLKVRFNNPSIKDFMENYIHNNTKDFELLCKSSVYFEQCIELFNISIKDNYNLVKLYRKDFIESVQSNIFYFDKMILSNLGYISPNFLMHVGNSVVERVIYVIRINSILNFHEIDLFVKDELLVKIKDNFGYYGCTLNGLLDLLEAVKYYKRDRWLTDSYVFQIFEYAIERAKKGKVEFIEEYKLFIYLYDYNERLFSNSTIDEIGHYFRESLSDESYAICWNNIEQIDNYIDELNKINAFFNVDLYGSIEYLEEQKLRIDIRNEIDPPASIKDKLEDYDETAILNIFDSLRR